MIDVYIDPSFAEYYERFPLVLVDVGASGGIPHTWDRARKHLAVIGFEPDDRAIADLAESPGSDGVTYLNRALHNRKATVDFHHARKQETSSLLRFNRAFLNRFPEPERFDVLETVQVETDTLDRQLQEHQIHDVDFIKLDTQGTELFILQGAMKICADTVFGLEIEVEFIPLYQEQPLFSDVDAFVRGLGFQLMDLKNSYWKRSVGLGFGGAKGQLIFADTLYMREPNAFVEMLRRAEDDVFKRSKVLKAFSICMVYGYLDYALEILEMTGAIFSDNESQLIGEKIKGETVPRNRIPNFRGRGRVANALRRLSKTLEPNYVSHQGWSATSEKPLGNAE